MGHSLSKLKSDHAEGKLRAVLENDQSAKVKLEDDHSNNPGPRRLYHKSKRTNETITSRQDYSTVTLGVDENDPTSPIQTIDVDPRLESKLLFADEDLFFFHNGSYYNIHSLKESSSISLTRVNGQQDRLSPAAGSSRTDQNEPGKPRRNNRSACSSILPNFRSIRNQSKGFHHHRIDSLEPESPIPRNGLTVSSSDHRGLQGSQHHDWQACFNQERIDGLLSAIEEQCLAVQQITRGIEPGISTRDISIKDLSDLQTEFSRFHETLGKLSAMLDLTSPSLRNVLYKARESCSRIQADLGKVFTSRQSDVKSQSLDGPDTTLADAEHLVQQVQAILVYSFESVSTAAKDSALKRQHPANAGQYNDASRLHAARRPSGQDMPQYHHLYGTSKDGLVSSDMERSTIVACPVPDPCIISVVSTGDTGDLTGDVIKFEFLEKTPKVTSFVGWTATTPSGCINSGHLTWQTILNHVATKLKVHRSLISMWCDGIRLTHHTLPRALGSHKLNEVKLIVDPFITVQSDHGPRFFISFWNDNFNKAYAPISDLKRRLREQWLTIPYHEWGFYLADKLLDNESLTLADSGLLTPRQKEGLDRIYLRLGSVKKTCMTCVEELDSVNFPERISASCFHTINTCKKCVSKWIDERLTNQGHTRINCPECSMKMSYSDVRSCTTISQFERYDRLVLLNALASEPDFHWCLSPTCSSGQLHSLEFFGERMFCCACEYVQCIKHSSGWHDSETCAEYDARMSRTQADELAAAKKVEEISKNCPSL
ncbi:hypothetical protein BT63DRAFT_416563 [Microthyrium microscopicum]|uniref:RING-type domain-containing protein n=1 Tax=Microthyrium microscopicum TaxID=703497 RepID=A0A6A6U1I0_9PEZI|nr:hypothetical protein BT63DRAFT_416563 [Microthyrium microscopicum]